MSSGDMGAIFDMEKGSKSVFEVEDAKNCLLPMGHISDIIGKKFNVDRVTCDKFSVHSHVKALECQKQGW